MLLAFLVVCVVLIASDVTRDYRIAHIVIEISIVAFLAFCIFTVIAIYQSWRNGQHGFGVAITCLVIALLVVSCAVLIGYGLSHCPPYQCL